MNFNYQILQLKSKDNSHHPYMFMDWEWACRNNFDIDDYEEVYNNSIELEDSIVKNLNEEDIANYVLEKLFYIFNVEHPSDFNGHSMSISDVVILNGVHYYCDSFGFVKID